MRLVLRTAKSLAYRHGCNKWSHVAENGYRHRGRIVASCQNEILANQAPYRAQRHAFAGRQQHSRQGRSRALICASPTGKPAARRRLFS
jgi:hypothetical protein